MAIKRQIAYSRVAVRLLMAAGAAALMAGCSDASRLSDPFADPFTPGGAPKVSSYRGVDRAPTGAISNPAPARVDSRPLPAPSAQAAGQRTPAPVASAAPLPGGPGASHWTADGGTPITVASGETAAMLATRFGVPTDALLRANGYSSAAQVQTGTRLIIPVYRAGAVAHSSPAAAPAAAPAPVKVAEAKSEPKLDPKAQAAAAREEQRKAEAAAKAAREEQAKAERAAKLARDEEAKSKKAKAAAEEQELKRQKKAEAEKAAEEARLAKIEAEKEAAQKAAETKRLADAKAAEAKKLAEAKKAEAKKDAEMKAAEAKAAAEKAKLAKAEATKSKADAAKAAEAKAEAAKAAEEAKLAKAEAAKAAKAERLAKAEAAREEAAAAAAEKQAAAAEKQQQKVAQAEKPAEPAPAARQVDKTTTASIPPAEEATKVSLESDKPEFRWPARGRIIQGFSSGGNDGINIAVPEGTPVKAAEGGTVAYAGSELKGYGNLVLIRHPNGFVTAYAHNGAIDVKRGDTVKRGQTIAKSGQSGNVGSPQLHFELRKGSTPVDPTNYLAGL